jgi:pimeloyl-ACP methyl ester carboxylesterase
MSGGELVDRVGPCILVTHSAGGPFGWLVANEKPNLVKAVVSFEGATAPLVGQGGAAGTPLPNLKGMPIMYLLSERGGRPGKPILDALLQSGARAEVIDLKESKSSKAGSSSAFRRPAPRHPLHVCRGDARRPYSRCIRRKFTSGPGLEKPHRS